MEDQNVKIYSLSTCSHCRATKKYLDECKVQYEFEDVDIVPDSITGVFDNHRLDELIEFCAKNPDYHIVSSVNVGLYFNKVVPHAQEFFLAEGDSNPDLVCFEDYKLAQYLADRKARRMKHSS